MNVIATCFLEKLLALSTDKTCLRRFPTKPDSNQSPQLQRLDRLVKFCGCAVWSVLLLFANPRRQVFSHQGPYNIIAVLQGHDQTDLKYQARGCTGSRDLLAKLEIEDLDLILREALAGKELWCPLVVQSGMHVIQRRSR